MFINCISLSKYFPKCIIINSKYVEINIEHFVYVGKIKSKQEYIVHDIHRESLRSKK